jgi:tRNA(Ile)-lysidine synthase
MRGARPERDLELALERSGAIRGAEHVLVACSGGPDSVALAAALAAVAPRMGLTLRAAFVNHQTRTSSWQDECVVLQIAAQLDIRLDILALRDGMRGEQQMRDARYDALIGVAKQHGCNVIATAHHAEDQSETVLLALLRGSGAGGLGGMQQRRSAAPGVDLSRPFLGVASERLRAYCHARALPYAVDPTNAQTNLRRNAVREALAALRPLFPGLDAAVARAASIARDERDDSLRAQLRRSVREQLDREAELRDIDFVHVEAAVRALERGRTGTFHMKPGIALRIERGIVTGITRE